MGPPGAAGPKAGEKSAWVRRQPCRTSTVGGASPHVSPYIAPPASDRSTRGRLVRRPGARAHPPPRHTPPVRSPAMPGPTQSTALAARPPRRPRRPHRGPATGRHVRRGAPVRPGRGGVGQDHRPHPACGQARPRRLGARRARPGGDVHPQGGGRAAPAPRPHGRPGNGPGRDLPRRGPGPAARPLGRHRHAGLRRSPTNPPGWCAPPSDRTRPVADTAAVAGEVHWAQVRMLTPDAYASAAAAARRQAPSGMTQRDVAEAFSRYVEEKARRGSSTSTISSPWARPCWRAIRRRPPPSTGEPAICSWTSSRT